MANSSDYIGDDRLEEDEVEECIHGLPVWANCPQCEYDDEVDVKYHAKKDDGLLDG
jgi:hypothetical protein